MFNFLVSTFGCISKSCRSCNSSEAVPHHNGCSSDTTFAMDSSIGSAGSFQSSVSAFVSFHTHCSLSKSRSNCWSCWSRPATSKTALLSVLFSFCITNAPSAAPNNPFVPEIMSKLSEDSIFLVWCTTNRQILCSSLKAFSLVTIS